MLEFWGRDITTKPKIPGRKSVTWIRPIKQTTEIGTTITPPLNDNTQTIIPCSVAAIYSPQQICSIINMNWIYNICSCITPQLKFNVIEYLNSNSLNRQVIEQQKCSESHDPQTEPTDHIYKLAKSRSINFMKLEDKSDDEEEADDEQENDQIIDAFWYAKMKKGDNQMDHFRYLFTHKSKVLGIILEQEPSSNGYDKVYDSQDEINLKIYCKLQCLVRGKKVNSYRFSFLISDVKLEDYEKWMEQLKQKDILALSQENKVIEADPNDPGFVVSHRYYQKLLVISPHDLITVQKTVRSESEEKSIKTVIFSVEPQQKQKSSDHSRGWLHLCGVQATESEKGLRCEGYFCIELDVSVSPNMLKQPIAKQIRILVQKMVCGLKKSDEI